MGRELAVALTDEPSISYIVLTDLAEPHLCIVRRSLRSCIDGRGGVRKDSANATVFTERTEAGHRILINDFSGLGLIEGRVYRLPTVTIRAGAPTGAASISALTITILPMSRHQENCIYSLRTRIMNLMVAGKIPEGECGISSAVVLPGTKGAYRRPSMLWKKLVEGRYWKLIDEKAHQSTEGIVAAPRKCHMSNGNSQRDMCFHYREVPNLAR